MTTSLSFSSLVSSAPSIDDIEAARNAARIYRIEHAGQTHEPIAYADVAAVLARVTLAAPGVPEVTEITPPTPATRALLNATPVAPATVAPAYTPAGAARGVVGGADQVDATGAARATADFAAAKGNGFAPEQSLYTRGTRVVQMGINNAREFRAEYDAKPLIGDACDGLIAQVASEKRADVSAQKTALRMDAGGRLVIDAQRRVEIEARAFPSLVARLGIPNGAQYLAGCWPMLRAQNVNQWQARAADGEKIVVDAAAAAGKEVTPDLVTIRTRVAPATETKPARRVGYAVVSDGYTEFDADKLARAVKMALPTGARADVHYDGFRAKITALFHSTVNPVDYVSGEFFRAGIVVKTDDTGRGSVKGWAVIEQNLCLNLYVISKRSQPIFSVRHVGDPVLLAQKIRDGLKKGEEALGHFLKAWGYARQDDLVVAAKARGELYEGMSMSAVFAALANGAIERELVPVRGRRTEVVSALVAAWEADRSMDGPSVGTITRAGLTNAFTRYAHESANVDPFFATEIEAAASDLLWPVDDRVTVPPMIQAIPVAV